MIRKIIAILFFLKLFEFSNSLLKSCNVENHILKFYKIKSCYKSTLPVISWKHVVSVDECKTLVREKNGLAFNFSPSEAENFTKSYLPNCHVLGCPEIGNDSTTLIMDLAYDYYSAYGNFNLTENATCVKSLGLFTLTNTYSNYSQSVLSCQNASGDLADVTSEYRTVQLSKILQDNMVDWYKVVYVGLDDIQTEGVFRTSSGKLLTCSNYRSWAPGHPRSKHKLEDCVTLDSENIWRVVKCNKVKLKGLCELYPQPPDVLEKVPKNVTCSQISKKDKGRKRKCMIEKELFQIYQNASRIDRCALLNF